MFNHSCLTELSVVVSWCVNPWCRLL